MPGALLFTVSEVVVLILAVGSLAAGMRLARVHRTAGYCLCLGALAWLAAEGVHGLQVRLLAPKLGGEEHDSLRVIVNLLGDVVYFGIGGIGILLLFLAAVADRDPRGDRRPEPVAVARKVGAVAWRYYQERNRRERDQSRWR